MSLLIQTPVRSRSYIGARRAPDLVKVAMDARAARDAAFRVFVARMAERLAGGLLAPTSHPTPDATERPCSPKAYLRALDADGFMWAPGGAFGRAPIVRKALPVATPHEVTDGQESDAFVVGTFRARIRLGGGY